MYTSHDLLFNNKQTIVTLESFVGYLISQRTLGFFKCNQACLSGKVLPLRKLQPFLKKKNILPCNVVLCLRYM